MDPLSQSAEELHETLLHLHSLNENRIRLIQYKLLLKGTAKDEVERLFGHDCLIGEYNNAMAALLLGPGSQARGSERASARLETGLKRASNTNPNEETTEQVLIRLLKEMEPLIQGDNELQ